MATFKQNIYINNKRYILITNTKGKKDHRKWTHLVFTPEEWVG